MSDIPTDLKKIIDLTVDALIEDSAHHKQWYLERILEVASGKSVEENKKEAAIKTGLYKDLWEDGVAP